MYNVFTYNIYKHIQRYTFICLCMSMIGMQERNKKVIREKIKAIFTYKKGVFA